MFSQALRMKNANFSNHGNSPKLVEVPPKILLSNVKNVVPQRLEPGSGNIFEAQQTQGKPFGYPSALRPLH